MKKRIILIGFRAVGKTTIGKKLAAALNYGFMDSDEVVTENAGKSVSEIVDEGGWERFRSYEREALKKMAKSEKCVIATGGGAVMHEEVWGLLKKDSFTVWLHGDIDTIRERIAGDPVSLHQRPSLNGNGVDDLEQVLETRAPIYDKLSDFKVDTGKLDIHEVVFKILDMLEKGEN